MCPRYCAPLVMMALYLGPLVVSGQEAPAAAGGSTPAAAASVAALPTQRAWTSRLPGAPSADGARDEERIYIPVDTTELYALVWKTGAVAWMQNATTTGPPVVRGSSVWVGGTDRLTEFDAATGARRREVTLSAPVAGPMTLAGDLLLVPTSPGSIVAVSTADGTIRWQQTPGAPTRGRAALSGGTLAIFALTDARLIALSLADGQLLWTRTLTGDLTEPAAAGDRLFVGTSARALHAFEPASGNLAWSWATGGGVVGTAADDARVYVLSLDNVIRALDRSSGNQQWRAVTQTRPLAGPQLVDSLLVVAGVRPALLGYHTEHGTPSNTFTLDGDLEHALVYGLPLFPPTASGPDDVAAVIVTRDGNVVGLRAPAVTAPKEASP